MKNPKGYFKKIIESDRKIIFLREYCKICKFLSDYKILSEYVNNPIGNNFPVGEKNPIGTDFSHAIILNPMGFWQCPQGFR